MAVHEPSPREPFFVWPTFSSKLIHVLFSAAQGPCNYLPFMDLALSDMGCIDCESGNDMKPVSISKGVSAISCCPVECAITKPVKLDFMTPDGLIEAAKGIV